VQQAPSATDHCSRSRASLNGTSVIPHRRRRRALWDARSAATSVVVAAAHTPPADKLHRRVRRVPLCAGDLPGSREGPARSARLPPVADRGRGTFAGAFEGRESRPVPHPVGVPAHGLRYTAGQVRCWGVVPGRHGNGPQLRVIEIVSLASWSLVTPCTGRERQ
jgi:hypothetical protein